MQSTERRRRNEARCERILDRSEPLPIADLRWQDVGVIGLDDRVVASLVYMRDVEGFTDRDLVGLTAHGTTLADPFIARFLPIWRTEEAGHAAALDRYLHAYGQARGIDIPPRQLPPAAVAAPPERILSKIGGPVGRIVAAAHMTWGAANELLTLTGYRLLAERCGDPILTELLTRIAAQEARHYSFYLLQAEWRLARSPLARATLRRVLRTAWTPVGIGDGYKRPSEFAVVMRYLASGREGEASLMRMDARFARLPGFSQLQIYRDAVDALAA